MFGWKDENYHERIENHKCMISQDIGYQVFATCKLNCTLLLTNSMTFRINYSDDVLSAADFHSDALLENISSCTKAYQQTQDGNFKREEKPKIRSPEKILCCQIPILEAEKPLEGRLGLVAKLRSGKHATGTPETSSFLSDMLQHKI